MKIIKNITVVILFTFSLFLASCGNKHSSMEASEGESHEEHETSNLATFTAEQVASVKLELGTIEKKQLTASLKANGILTVPNQNRATITALMGGVIKSILVQTGNNVIKGQVIATIANTSFITMQEEYLSVSSKLTLAEIEFKRQQELQAGNASSLKSLQNSEAELKTLKARKVSLQKQLELIGISTNSLTGDNIQAVINITSPIAGVISKLSVNMGTYVDANNSIAEVIDNSQLHLDLFIYERDLTKLKEGQTIHFTLTNNPGKEYDAKVYAISNTFEQNTKAVAVHAMVEGDKTGLIDGMSITAIISLEHATVDAVPTEAIVGYQGQDYIFIVTDKQAEAEHHEKEDAAKHDEHEHHHKDAVPAEGDLTFERIPVRKGTSDIGYSEITVLKEIPARAKIATKGAFFILAKMTNTGEHEH
jgi:membrane fusion protein, heavy metal efflux system